MKDYNLGNRRAYLKNFQPLEQACKRKQWELNLVAIILTLFVIIGIIK